MIIFLGILQKIKQMDSARVLDQQKTRSTSRYCPLCFLEAIGHAILYVESFSSTHVVVQYTGSFNNGYCILNVQILAGMEYSLLVG